MVYKHLHELIYQWYIEFMDQKTLLSQVCKTFGFTQQDLADVLRVDKNTVARWSRAERELSEAISGRLQQMLVEKDTKNRADGNVLDRWDRIKDEKVLQRLANHIARFEFWPEQIFASNPYGGGDEGWDGGTLTGSMLIQAKFSDDDRPKAFKYIKTSVAKEYSAAIGKGIKRYILATNVDLLPSQIQLLQSIKKNKGPEIIIWNKETLTLLAQEHRWVLHNYFEYPQVPRLIPAFVFQEKNVYHTPCVGFEELVNKLSEFCQSDDCLMVVKGGAHVGKSRLLWESLGHISATYPAIHPWVLRSEYIRPCREAIENEINLSRGNHLILLDDAQLHYEDVEELAEFTHAKRDNLKAIVFTNASAMPLIQKALRKRGARDHKLIDVPRLATEQLVQVFLQASGGYKPDKPERIVKTLDNDLFLITEIGTRLKSRTGEVKVLDVLDEHQIDLVRQSSELLELSSKQSDLLLTELSLIAPFPVPNSSDSSNKIHSQIATHCGLNVEEYQACITRLQNGEILTSVGNYLSFKSKWIGYFFLRQKIVNAEGPTFCEKALGRWIELVPNRVLANIATAGFDEGSGPVTKVLRDLLSSWTREAEITTPTKRRHRLEVLRGITSIVPSHVLGLIQQYLDVPAKKFEEDLIKWGIEERNPDLDDFGPLIQEVGKLPEYVVSALTLLSKIRPHGLRHHFSNYAVPELVKRITQSQLVDTRSVRQIIDYELSHDLGLFLDSFKVVMASVLELHDSFETTITISPLVVPAIPEVIETRQYTLNHALRIFNDLSCADALTCEFVHALGDVGERLNHFPLRGELPLKKIIFTEKQLILKAIEEKIPKIANESPESFRVLAEMELLLLRWWSEDDADAAQLERILSHFPRTPLYLAFRCFEKPEEIVFDFGIVLSKAGKKTRRMWLLKNGSGWTAGIEFYKPLVTKIFESYPDNNSLFEFLTSLSNCISGKCTADPLIIEAICVKKKGFAELALQSELFKTFHIKIQSAFKKIMASGSSDYIRSWGQTILQHASDVSEDEIFRFLITLMNSDLDDQARFDLLVPLCASTNMIIKRDVAFRCSAILKRDKTLLLKIVEKLNGLENWNLHHQISFILMRIVEEGIAIPSTLGEKLLDQLKQIPKLEHDHQQILNLVCRSFDALLSFVEYRFAEDAKENKEYEAIPYEGLECVSKLVQSEDQAEKLLNFGFKIEEESKGILRYRVEYLLKALPFTNLNKQGSYLESSIAEKLAQSDYPKIHSEIWWRMCMIKVRESNEKLFVQALEVADNHGLLEGVKGDFWSCLTESTWCGSIGSAPAHLVGAQERVTSMKTQTKQARVVNFLEAVFEGLKKQIDWHLRHDQDFVANH